MKLEFKENPIFKDFYFAFPIDIHLNNESLKLEGDANKVNEIPIFINNKSQFQLFVQEKLLNEVLYILHEDGILEFNIYSIPSNTNLTPLDRLLFKSLDTDFIYVLLPGIYDNGTNFDENQNRPCYFKLYTCETPILDLSEEKIRFTNCLNFEIICLNK